MSMVAWVNIEQKTVLSKLDFNDVRFGIPAIFLE